MKTSTLIILGSCAAVGIGVAVFLGTREAKAGASASKAFSINADCSVIEVVDTTAFETAVEAAALASFQGLDDPAEEFLDRAFVILLKNFPQCPARLDGTTVVKIPNQLPVPIAVVRTIVDGKTVGEVKDMAQSGAFTLEGSVGNDAQPPYRDRIVNALFRGI